MNKFLKRAATLVTSLLLAVSLSISAVGCTVQIGGSTDNTNQGDTNQGDTNQGDTNQGDTNNGDSNNNGDTNQGDTSGNGSSNSGGGTHEHNYVKTATVEPTCTTEGYVAYTCTICRNVDKKYTDALGHLMEDSSKSVRYLIPCSRGCGYAEMPQNNNKYAEELKYDFTDEDKEYISEVLSSLNATIKEVGDYTDDDVYIEGSDFYDKNEDFVKLFNQLYSAVYYVVYQNYCGELQYHVDTTNEDAKTSYQSVSDYYSQLVQDYYSLFKSINNSKLRNYFFYGWTEEEIADILSYSEAYDEELTALNNRNTEILLEYNTKGALDKDFTTLYAEFVENNNQIAQKNGYDNYLDYAYSEIYSRDYTYEDVHEIAEYYKQYLAPSLSNVINSYSTSVKALTANENQLFEELDSSSFFSDITANSVVNSFLNEISLYGSINYAQLFEEMIDNGNYVLGNYDGAYTVYIDYINLPVTFYGENYQSPSTIVHEFGHYTNDYYKNIIYKSYVSQSYDLLETHSHAMEYMLLSYLKDVVGENVSNAMKYYEFTDAEISILLYMAVNMFEEAVYTNTYTGTNADKIMADNKVTSDEYSLLFAGIMCDFGLGDYVHSTYTYYWRYVVIPQPCYYVSYSFSTLASLQFYIEAEEKSLSDAVISHNKLIDYVNDHPDYTYSQALEYAGLLSINDEQLYKNLSDMFNS
jgi:hypothetical protein